MPRRTDLKHVLVIGSGPIVIGQACEFDYSGTQACRVLRSEGLTVSLVNSNPATIMTDPEYADFTYVEPITPLFVEKVIAQQAARGNPIDALLATLGGQTALNTAVALYENGALDRYNVELIGADYEAIQRGETEAALSLGAEGSVMAEAVIRFSLLSALSTRNEDPTRASRPFEKTREGFVMSEGAAALVLADRR